MRFGSLLCCREVLTPLFLGATFALLASTSTAASQTVIAAKGCDPDPAGIVRSSSDFSSSLDAPDPLPETPAASPASADRLRALPAGDREPRPFHSLAVGFLVGIGGLGVELATPINTKLNLRGSASLFSHQTSFVVDTIPINGTLHLSNYNVVVDYFPRARSFHISPGITFYDRTRFDANILVPGGQVVTFNDQDYTSDPSDPIRGTAYIHAGSNFAPRLTVGYGNVIRHNTRWFTFPVEIGVEAIRTPTATFNLTGSSCDPTGDCGPIDSDPQTQQNIAEQQAEINRDIKPLRFFPIFSFGISYKFGH